MSEKARLMIDKLKQNSVDTAKMDADYVSSREVGYLERYSKICMHYFSGGTPTTFTGARSSSDRGDENKVHEFGFAVVSAS